MRVFIQVTTEIEGKEIPAGSFIDISDESLDQLDGKVAYIKDGKLFVPRHAGDLASLIAGLTPEDLSLQKKLLLLHCQAFGPQYIQNIWEEWERKVDALLSHKEISREEAEFEAAKELNLLAFLDEYTAQNMEG